jgi:type IV pilus assembly protein PilM
VASTRVIGLDIGTSAVRAAEMEFSGRGKSGTAASLVRYAEAPLPPGAVRDGEVAEPATVSTVLKQLWSHAKLGSRDVVIGVGNQRVLVREMELPWMPVAQLKEALPYQVQESLPMSTDEALLDFYPTDEIAGPQGRALRGMLVAAQRDTVNANVLAVEGAGLRPSMVDLNAFALLRALARGDMAQRVVALVEIGASVTNVVIAAHGVPRLVRTLPSGGNNVTQAIASGLGVAAPEAEAIKRAVGVAHQPPPGQEAAAEAIGAITRQLVEGIRNTFVYYQGNHPGAGIEGVILTGGGAHLPGLGQYLSSASRLPVAFGDALAGVRRPKNQPDLSGLESRIALPVGLAYGVAA